MAEMPALTVTQLNNYIKLLIESDLPLRKVVVSGEISDFKWHSSGHVYFTLKDETSILQVVMFDAGKKLSFKPESGMCVLVTGRIGVFLKTGRYQLYADFIEPDGIGALYIAYEQLKKKLESEGLFAQERKKHLPKIPRRVGVVTSPTGAVIRDILTVSGRRFPFAEIVLFPSAVQGTGAAKQLAEGISYFGSSHTVDCVIIGRGGGSLEDLWEFNDETLARTIAACPLPVVSAVGHETDFTICDFVSDIRAPTPSAAAELVFPDTAELQQKFLNVISREYTVLTKTIDAYHEKLNRLATSRVLTDPMNLLTDRQMAVTALEDRMNRAQENRLALNESRLAAVVGKMNALNPLSVLSRGYTFVSGADGEILKSAKNIKKNDEVTLRFTDGEAKATVTSVHRKRKG